MARKTTGARKPSPAQARLRESIKQAMSEYKAGKLKNAKGQMVKTAKEAFAIGAERARKLKPSK
jgi:hypothetical protein